MKKFFSIVLVLAMALGLFACGKPEEAGGEPAAPAEPEGFVSKLGSEPVTITFWHCASDAQGQLIDKYVDEYNKSNGKQVTVNAVYQGQYSDATTLLKSILSAENYSELPDVMQMDATGKVDYFNSGKAFTATDAEALFEESVLGDYLDAALGNWTFSGAALGLPFATSTTITYYNKDLLAQAGWNSCPDTFADLIRLGEDFRAAKINVPVIGTVPNTPTLANWLGQLGSYVVNNRNGSDGTADKLECVDNGALKSFLSEWKALYDSGALTNDALSTSAFVAGQVAVFTSSSSNIKSVLDKVGGAFEVGVAPYLRVNSSASHGATVSGSFLAMFDSDDQLKKEAAWDFVKYMTGESVQADFAVNTGYIPANKAAAENSAYKALLESTPQFAVGPEQLAKTPSEMRSVTVGPSTDFYYAIMNNSSDMLANGQSVDDTVSKMAEELQGLLDAYKRANQ